MSEALARRLFCFHDLSFGLWIVTGSLTCRLQFSYTDSIVGAPSCISYSNVYWLYGAHCRFSSLKGNEQGHRRAWDGYLYGRELEREMVP